MVATGVAALVAVWKTRGALRLEATRSLEEGWASEVDGLRRLLVLLLEVE